ncbi:ATP-binding cassette sub-family b member 9 [Chrysochromulina tobinii]|uniref:ATP-binding cassette sub-family b member 9 n=1 Tax=Chrysochromulina tobinii TaxID=1460289 RepID=A0A0M0JL13_9EUKA|nr:ATP-binding cassette sub-family b member 9 [Chrysochromulina tobinii]|eukprot:KOO27175.1 ATP-binding cassette sub-family b member 9 [Chrysochromulina sp. CCMP291]
MAGVGVATAIFTGLRGFTFWLCGARLVKRLRATLFECLLQQPQAFHDEQGPGELSSRLATDCVKLGDVLSLNVNIVLRQVIQSLAGIAIIVRINARLAALVLCGVAIRSVFAHYYSKFSRRVSQEMQDALATSSGVAEQCFSLIKVVRSHGNAAYERERYVQQLNRLLQLDTERGAVYGFSRVFNGAVNAFLLFGILTLGAAFVSAGLLPKESLTSFVLYVTFISEASSDVADQWSRIQEALGAATEVFDYLEPRPLDLGLSAVLAPVGSASRVLSKLSLRVPGGQRLAIVGGSGSGKSTIFALALRFYAAGRGRVLLDGQDVLTMDEADLRRQIAWVQQEPPLFPNTTVRENIAYGLVDCPMERIEAAAKEANAYEFVMGLPQGFDTRIGAAGASLSGGQKQRVALARALVRDPSLLLLDEATSALDPESEQLVEAAIARAAAERTVLFTTHKVAQARNADRIIVLAHGVIVEEGSHNELLRRNGAYAQLVRASKGGGVSEAEAGALIDQAAGIVEEDPLPPELAIGTV